MAKQVASPNPAAEGAEPLDHWSTFALEAERDRKLLYWGYGTAVVFHIILFMIHFSGMGSKEVKGPEKQKVYVVNQVRFKPPPPQQEQELIKPRSKKVPIPDPTPDEPEPIRTVDEIRQDLDIPIDDSLFGIPEGPPPAEPEGPIMVGGNVLAPEKIHAPPPAYTEIARKARITGVVIVQAIVDKEGNVTNVKLLKGLGFGLDESAMEAIKQWKFKPATLNGKPVTVYYNLTVNFKLQ